MFQPHVLRGLGCRTEGRLWEPRFRFQSKNLTKSLHHSYLESILNKSGHCNPLIFLLYTEIHGPSPSLKHRPRRSFSQKSRQRGSNPRPLDDEPTVPAIKLTNCNNPYSQPKGSGVMNSPLACCAGGPGSIPTFGKKAKKSNVQIVVGYWNWA